MFGRSLTTISKLSGITLRSFSEAAKHQPPKKITGTVGKYAGALYTAASKV
jgi:hypothetical protein